jgi:sugar/nucleoside kinase (ribokinase family)
MSDTPDILCIGAVLWDVIGRASRPMRAGDDRPGRISRVPGGVALNIAMTLRRFGLAPALLTAVGRDADGEALIEACARMGLDTRHVYRSDDLPTDRYMAIEAAGTLIAAIADAHSLEAAGAKILAPLTGGALGSEAAPYPGTVALDGNLTEALLGEIARSPAFAAADLRIAPASPGKAERLVPLLGTPGATLYVNREEAGLICGAVFEGAEQAARVLRERGAARVLVTDGARPAALAAPDGVLTATPPEVLVTRVTGAGDTFMAAHIAAEREGAAGAEALDRALQAAAAHISGGATE